MAATGEMSRLLLPLGVDSAFVCGWSREFYLGLNLNSVEKLTPFRLIWSRVVGAVPVAGGAAIILVLIFFRAERHKQDN